MRNEGEGFSPRATTYLYPQAGKIVIVEHPGAVLGYNNVNEIVVQQMFDAGIMEFTGITSSPSAALASLFPGLTTARKIAIKPNLINSSVPTRKELVKAVITRLVGMLGGFPAANITLYERHAFSSAGYSTSYFGQPVNLVVDTTFPNLGYTIHCDGKDRPYSKSLYEADYLINMPVAKDHSCSTALNFTFAFKNHMGTVNPGGSLGIHCNKTAILDVMASSVMVSKQRLVILDALYAIYNGGPSGSPQASPCQIMIAQDPVTIDAQGRLLINSLRAAHNLAPKAGTYIDEAAAPPYNIGIANPSAMNVTRILLPVRLALFSAALEGERVILRWATVEERNNAGFSVERRPLPDGEWKTIGFVPANKVPSPRSEYTFEDRPGELISAFERLSYRLKQVDTDGSFEYSVAVDVRTRPEEGGWMLEENYPNPFSSETDIPVYLPRGCHLTLEILDTKGVRVDMICDKFCKTGQHVFRFSAGSLSSGVYICRGTAEGRTVDMHMILTR
ncbi:MAG: DUF362 domain-containing protein [Bacteroidota bacterium]|nr:DUF362 domain-containing protein [Bacteroidota bacterium]